MTAEAPTQLDLIEGKLDRLIEISDTLTLPAGLCRELAQWGGLTSFYPLNAGPVPYMLMVRPVSNAAPVMEMELQHPNGRVLRRWRIVAEHGPA